MTNEELVDRMAVAVGDMVALHALEGGWLWDTTDDENRLAADLYATCALRSILELARQSGAEGEMSVVLGKIDDYWSSHGGNGERQQ